MATRAGVLYVVFVLGVHCAQSKQRECQEFGLTQLDKQWCEHPTSETRYQIKQLAEEKVLLVPSVVGRKLKLCLLEAQTWTCKYVVFLIDDLDIGDVTQVKAEEASRSKRQAITEVLLDPHAPKKNTQATVVEIGGISWICEQLSELQCRPLNLKGSRTSTGRGNTSENDRQATNTNPGSTFNNQGNREGLTAGFLLGLRQIDLLEPQDSNEQDADLGGRSEHYAGSPIGDIRDNTASVVNNPQSRWEDDRRPRTGGQSQNQGRYRSNRGRNQGQGTTDRLEERVEVGEDGEVVIDGHAIHWESSPGGTQQAVYRINGITWLCKQQDQLQCFPVFTPWDDSATGSGSVAVQNPNELIDEEHGYPDYPGNSGINILPTEPPFLPFTTLAPYTLLTPYTTVPTRTSTSTTNTRGGRRPDRQTTFCSRAIRYSAKDEVLLKFNTYRGEMKLYIQAKRIGQDIELTARMLHAHEEELGGEENFPPVIMKTVVNCDTITIRVEGRRYKLDYDFGRDGVKDLEVIGDLETTGMVPRSNFERSISFGNRNLMTKSDTSPILLEPLPPEQTDPVILQPPPGIFNQRPESSSPSDYAAESSSPGSYAAADEKSPRILNSDVTRRPTPTGGPTLSRDSTTSLWGRISLDADTASYSTTPSPGDGQATTDSPQVDGESLNPVTDDKLQVNGNGDVEISLDEGEEKEHKYRISKGDDGEVNIEILFGDEGPLGNRTLVIDNKDYNYTLIITGENIQIVHHDTNKNLTYNHGLKETAITGVGVRGHVSGTSLKFKENQGTAAPRTQGSVPAVSIYGTLCEEPCEETADGTYWCTNRGGGSERCGPQPGVTPHGEECEDDCRKRGDGYFWCHRSNKPWDYCSPDVHYQERLVCYQDSKDIRVPDLKDCSRYLTCKKGEMVLEECPEGLHFNARNGTCEWPTTSECQPTLRLSSEQHELDGETTSTPVLFVTPETLYTSSTWRSRSGEQSSSSSPSPNERSTTINQPSSTAEFQTAAVSQPAAPSSAAASQPAAPSSAVTAILFSLGSSPDSRSPSTSSTSSLGFTVPRALIYTEPPPLKGLERVEQTEDTALDVQTPSAKPVFNEPSSIRTSLDDKQSDLDSQTFAIEVDEQQDGEGYRTSLAENENKVVSQTTLGSTEANSFAYEENVSRTSLEEINESKDDTIGSTEKSPLVNKGETNEERERTTEYDGFFISKGASDNSQEKEESNVPRSSTSSPIYTSSLLYSSIIAFASSPRPQSSSEASNIYYSQSSSPRVYIESVDDTSATGRSTSSSQASNFYYSQSSSPRISVDDSSAVVTTPPASNVYFSQSSSSRISADGSSAAVTSPPASNIYFSQSSSPRISVDDSSITSRIPSDSSESLEFTGEGLPLVAVSFSESTRVAGSSLGTTVSQFDIPSVSSARSSTATVPSSSTTSSNTEAIRAATSSPGVYRDALTTSTQTLVRDDSTARYSTANIKSDSTEYNSTTNSAVPRTLWDEDNSINDISDQDRANDKSKSTYAPTAAPSKGSRRPTSSLPVLYTSDPQENRTVTRSPDQILALASKYTGSLTAHGEQCLDGCEKRGFQYFWCNKKYSQLGQWWESDFCSPTPSFTHYGQECEDACEQRGEIYFWCHRKTGGWGYCSPQIIYNSESCTTDGIYAVNGDCRSYISCKEGRPIPFSCVSGLYFDYILKSCTFKKDVRCAGESLV